MKQKMLGAAAFFMTASVNSFAGSSGGDKGTKVDLSKLTDISVIYGIEIKKDGSGNTKLGEMKIKEGSNDKVFKTEATADKFKNDFKFVLLTGHAGNDCLKNTIKTYKFETEEEGKKLKLTEISGDAQKKIGPGNYVLVTVNDAGSEVTVEKKVFDKKQKLENNAYKDDDGK